MFLGSFCLVFSKRDNRANSPEVNYDNIFAALARKGLRLFDYDRGITGEFFFAKGAGFIVAFAGGAIIVEAFAAKFNIINVNTIASFVKRFFDLRVAEGDFVSHFRFPLSGGAMPRFDNPFYGPLALLSIGISIIFVPAAA